MAIEIRVTLRAAPIDTQAQAAIAAVESVTQEAAQILRSLGFPVDIVVCITDRPVGKGRVA